MDRKFSARDIFIGILYYIGKGKEIPTNYYRTHPILNKLKSKYPELMQGILFDTNGHFPYSEDIESAQSEFLLSRILELTNSVPRSLRIAATPSTEEMKRVFTKEQLSDLEKMAAEFQQELGKLN